MFNLQLPSRSSVIDIIISKRTTTNTNNSHDNDFNIPTKQQQQHASTTTTTTITNFFVRHLICSKNSESSWKLGLSVLCSKSNNNPLINKQNSLLKFGCHGSKEEDIPTSTTTTTTPHHHHIPTKYEIRALFHLWNHGIASNNVKTVTNRYATNATLFSTESDAPINGHQSIKQYYEELFEENSHNNSYCQLQNNGRQHHD